MKIRRNLPNAKAFTLVEVILAVTIIGITAAGLMAAFTNSLFIMRMARENQRATQILMERAEALRVFSWTEITNPPGPGVTNCLPTGFHDSYTPTNDSGDGLGAYYSGTITNTIPSWSGGASYLTNMREIDITVTWTNFNGALRTRTLTTYVARDGVQNYVY